MDNVVYVINATRSLIVGCRWDAWGIQFCLAHGLVVVVGVSEV